MVPSLCIVNGSSSRALQPALVRDPTKQLKTSSLTSIAAALYSVGGVRTTFTIGVGAGGPAAYWLVCVPAKTGSLG